MRLRLISAGAAKGLVEALADTFRRDHGATIDATFGAVGMMKEQFLAGAACDAIVLTQALLEALARDGHVEHASIAPLGRVPTSIAIRAGDPAPEVANAESLRESLAGATSVYFPDPAKATAGIHFMSVVDRLSLRDTLADRLRPYPNGAAAMAALARATDARPIGCTQASEIRYTRGVSLVANLPRPFELVTLYSAAVASKASDPALAKRFVTLLCGDATRALREPAGFSA
jgi:molybdate transport system substrate-binding protein